MSFFNIVHSKSFADAVCPQLHIELKLCIFKVSREKQGIGNFIHFNSKRSIQCMVKLYKNIVVAIYKVL